MTYPVTNKNMFSPGRNRMKLILSLCIAIAFIHGGLNSIFAQVTVVSEDPSLEEGIIRKQIPNGGDDNAWSWNNNGIGQSFFMESDATIKAVALLITTASTRARGREFTLNIYKLGNGADNPEMGELIASQTGNLPEQIFDNTCLTFTLEKPVSLDTGFYYLFAFTTTVEGSSVGIPRISTDNSDENKSYMWGYEDGAWSRNRARSLTITLLGELKTSL